jgi:predicted outer membrane protein
MKASNWSRTIALSAVVACLGGGCSRGGDASAEAAARQLAAAKPVASDSAAGEVAQFALMKNSIGWLTDSNLVSLASLVNQAPIALARVEAQLWSDEQIHAFALEVLRDHTRLQGSIDSLAGKRRIPSQRPAVAESMQQPYDSLVASLAAMPLQQMEPRFLEAVIGLHERTLVDFAALAGNAEDPDLRALIANRAITMEQAHAAKAKVMIAAAAKADSVRAAERPPRRR